MTKVSADRGFPKVASCSPWDTDSGRDFATRIHVSNVSGIHICGQERKRGSRRGERERQTPLTSWENLELGSSLDLLPLG